MATFATVKTNQVAVTVAYNNNNGAVVRQPHISCEPEKKLSYFIFLRHRRIFVFQF